MSDIWCPKNPKSCEAFTLPCQQLHTQRASGRYTNVSISASDLKQRKQFGHTDASQCYELMPPPVLWQKQVTVFPLGNNLPLMKKKIQDKQSFRVGGRGQIWMSIRMSIYSPYCRRTTLSIDLASALTLWLCEGKQSLCALHSLSAYWCFVLTASVHLTQQPQRKVWVAPCLVHTLLHCQMCFHWRRRCLRGDYSLVYVEFIVMYACCSSCDLSATQLKH